MIYIKKDYNNPPKELFSKSIINAVKEAVKNGNADHIENRHYNPNGIIKKLLERVYNGKCGYCESKVSHVAALQVEHYRPKKKIDLQDEKKENNGYYWLACEWSNLLLSCPSCNQNGAKGNRFPITGTRITDHSYFLANGVLDRKICLPNSSPLKDEEPLLLNPELCTNPENHFKYDTNGKVTSQTDEGRATIDICSLNRYDLIKNRKKVIESLINEIKIVLLFISGKHNPPNSKNAFKKIFDDLISVSILSEEYTLLRKDIIDRFSDIVLPGIEKRFQKPVEKAFSKYQNGTL